MANKITKPVKEACIRAISTKDGQIFLGLLLNEAGLFSNVGLDSNNAVMRNFFIGLLGELDLFKDTATFPLDFVRALTSLPGGKRSDE